ncbi:MAG TPA: hypothetical protein VEI28_03475, partial [Thermodesulfovibrionales bacterium]|nr:hypothetical protein [Thermodesulfovibrionales bacterium]
MKGFFLCRVARLTIGVLLAVSLTGAAAIVNAAEPTLDEEWHFTLMPYVWLPSVNGKMQITLPHVPSSFSTQSNDFNIGKSSYLDNLSFAALVSMALEKGDWSLFTDFMYIDFSDSNRQVTFPNLPGGRLQINADTGFKAWVVEGGPAYSLYRSADIRFDFLAGVRYLGEDSHANLSASTSFPVSLPSRNFTYNKGLVDPIVGIKGRFELGKGWFIPYYFDGGGFGINNEWSWQAFG